MASKRNTLHGSQSTLRSSQASSRFTGKRSVAFDSKVEKPSMAKKPIVQVFDEGIDVTPRSLLGTDINTGSLKSSSKSVINFNDSASVAAPSDLLNQSMFGASTFQNSYATGFSKSMMSSMISSRTSLDSVTDEISEPHQMPQKFVELHEEIEHKTETPRVPLNADDLEKVITITLQETDTISLLDMPGVSVSINDDNANLITERNNKYEGLCASRHGNDRFVERGMQTFDNASKTKEMQTTPVENTDVGCMATNWDLYDTYNKSEEVEEGEDVDDDLLTFTTNTSRTSKKSPSKGSSSSHNTSHVSQASPGNLSTSALSESSLFSGSSNNVEETDETSSTTTIDTSAQMEKVMRLESFKENLFIMERTVVQNQYHSRQAAYRGVSDLKLFSVVDDALLPDEEEPQAIGPNISRLWSYECTATRGMAVTCMEWNKENKDLIAIGYSKNGFAENGKGLICVWSIKNPEYPERMYVPSCAVTAIDFSTTRPYLLSAGLFNGTIVLYNIQHSSDTPVLDSFGSLGKHSAPIWQLKWVDREKGTGEDRSEVLVSASGDGRVTQWSIRKGFEFIDLMKLKRVSNTAKNTTKKAGAPTRKNDAFISRYTSGMCFDFHSDGNVYLAGTEDGHVHRCSCSYNEQYLETYTGHKGPIYKMLWSPFNKNIFLTCSADWSIRLWHVDKTHPILTLQAAQATQAVIDIDWSPMSAVILAAINEQQVEIWDLTNSTLDPLTIHLPVTQVKLTSVKFALNSKAIIVGDADGHATIYQLKEINLDDNSSDDLLKIVESNLSDLSTDLSQYGEDEEEGTKSKSEFVER